MSFSSMCLVELYDQQKCLSQPEGKYIFKSIHYKINCVNWESTGDVAYVWQNTKWGRNNKNKI